ncbi:Disease resistance protein [Quillaja saponaria]|uniref:Disease resistance protein n=1 Tax=Quillaja saponaria TaxID=32244 RepID=A0AAD7KN79_QUISA|nr:Disease resistance protein [Quillaja saponaria]
MEVVLAIAGKVGEYTVAPIGRQLGYLFCYRSNLNELRKKAKMLEEAKESVQHLVDAARNNGEEIERGVLNWLGRVDETSLQVKNFQGDARHARAGSPKWIDTASTPAGYMAFESRAKILNEIMEALKNPDINMIGVYGLGGVGKTTLVKDVARKAQEDKLFDAVAMSVVAQKVEVNKIQKEIAEMLGMKLDEESEIVRASRLHDRLKQEKNVLMILDDLWVGVDLSKIGIPFGIKHKGCKLLLTSRDQEVLTNKIDVKKPFFLGVLPEEEAWELFKQMAGLENLKENSEFMSTTTEVAKKCAGLPIAIVTVGRALRNKSLSEWRDALLQMKRPTSRNSNRMQEVVDSSIKLSFDNLESEELKNIFLLCTMQMDYDIFFTDLLKYSVGLGLFTGIYTIKEARDRLNTLISKLKATCLLLDSYSSDFFTMHDVVRDAAISIASNLQHAFVVRYEKGNEWPEKEQLRICTAISLIKSDIGGLPEGMDCPSLKFFHLDNKESNSFPTPDSFFQGMRGLKTLCLDQCVLEDITVVGELKNLKALSLLSSDIKQLPHAIGQLTQLQLLDLQNCSKLEIIPPDIILNFKMLEVLDMENSFLGWEGEEANSKGINVSLMEPKNLHELNTLVIWIRDPSVMPGDLLFKNLKRYKILIGDVWNWSGKCKTSTTLKLKLNISFHLVQGVKRLLEIVEDLHLDELSSVKNVLYELNGEGFQFLKHLLIQNNVEIEYIVNSMNLELIHAFPILESLVIHNLIKLERICIGQLSVKSFSKLQEIEVKNCHKLKNVFAFSMVKSLSRSLLKIETPYMKNENDARMLLFSEKVELPKIETLKLSSINSHKIWQDQPSAASYWVQNLTSFIVEDCRNLKHLFSYSVAETLVKLKHLEICYFHMIEEIILTEGRISNSTLPHSHEALFPNLEALVISYMDNLKTIWSVDHVSPNSFGKLKSLNINYCKKLLSIVPSYMLRKLQNLETIKVGNCGSLNEIVRIDGGDEDHGEVHTRLKILSLDG